MSYSMRSDVVGLTVLSILQDYSRTNWSWKWRNYNLSEHR